MESPVRDGRQTQLGGRVALITGAARGIGAAIADTLSASGASVAVVDVDKVAADEAARRLRGIGRIALPVGCDIRDSAGVDRGVSEVVEAFGKIDILVNNAGIRRDRTLLKMSDEEWSDVVQVNLAGAFRCARAALPHMPGNTGRVISLSSRLFLGNVGSSNYAAAKAGLIGLSRSLALEIAPRRITVNVVAPGVIQTPGLEVFKAEAPAAYERFMATVPMGEPGSASDVASLVRFLASDEAAYITGQTIFVCGGWSIGAPAW